MSELKGKIDFTLFVSADNANPNGDPLNGNRPRINMDGHGEISDVCIKRKIRNRLQDLGQKIFVQSDDRTDDLYTSLKDRADGCEELKTQIGNKKNANRDACAAIACKEWLDVRAFGQVFAFKGIPVSFGVRGPVSIHQAISLSPIDVENMTGVDFAAFKEQQYDILAAELRKHLDMKKIYEILENGITEEE